MATTVRLVIVRISGVTCIDTRIALGRSIKNLHGDCLITLAYNVERILGPCRHFRIPPYSREIYP